MHVYRIPDNGYPRRQHPWCGAEHDQSAGYYNFRERPELIRSSLEDLLPFSDKTAIETWYQLLEWVNGPQSNLETNDVALRPISENKTPEKYDRALQIQCRMTVFHRHLTYNCFPQSQVALENSIGRTLNKLTPKFKLGAVEISSWETYFTSIEQQGSIVLLKLWAFGDSEVEVFDSLDKTLTNILAALKIASSGNYAHT